jgi:hypothetical protein
MASNAKRKTTMAKLNREAKMRDKKLRKQARKDQRKAEAAEGMSPEQRWATADTAPADPER